MSRRQAIRAVQVLAVWLAVISTLPAGVHQPKARVGKDEVLRTLVTLPQFYQAETAKQKELFEQSSSSIMSEGTFNLVQALVPKLAILRAFRDKKSVNECKSRIDQDLAGVWQFEEFRCNEEEWGGTMARVDVQMAGLEYCQRGISYYATWIKKNDHLDFDLDAWRRRWKAATGRR